MEESRHCKGQKPGRPAMKGHLLDITQSMNLWTHLSCIDPLKTCPGVFPSTFHHGEGKGWWGLISLLQRAIDSQWWLWGCYFLQWWNHWWCANTWGNCFPPCSCKELYFNPVGYTHKEGMRVERELVDNEDFFPFSFVEGGGKRWKNWYGKGYKPLHGTMKLQKNKT